MNIQPYIRTDIREELTTITFYHQLHNSLPSALLEELAGAIVQSGTNANCKLIVLQSAGEGTFCAGASFDELLTIQDETSGKAFFSGFAKVINAIREVPQLVIGRVQGKAIGGGVGLAAACDYCFATDRAAIKLSELSINIGPFVISPAVKRKMGLSAFTELSLNPTRFFEPNWAKRKGLFQQVSENASAMDEAITDFCRMLIDRNKDALFALKRDLWFGTGHWDTLLYEQASISGRLVLNDDAQKLLKEFKKS